MSGGGAFSGVSRLIYQVAELTRQNGFQQRVGTVHEVKGDKMRVALGKMANGQPFLTPWLHSGNHRGGATERRLYEKGQTVMLSAQSGDLRQAEVQAYAESNKFKPPAHANQEGDKYEDYQLGDYRIRHGKDGMSMWLQDSQEGQQGGQQQQAGGGQGGEEQWQQRQPEKPNGKMFIKMKKDGAISAVVDKKYRFMVNKEGVKMRADKMFAVVTEKKLIVSKPWEIDKDPLKDDDETDLA